MKSKGKYIIYLNELVKGKHKFNFMVEDDFFQEYKNVDIKTGELNINVDLEKDADILLALFYIKMVRVDLILQT